MKKKKKLGALGKGIMYNIKNFFTFRLMRRARRWAATTRRFWPCSATSSVTGSWITYSRTSSSHRYTVTPRSVHPFDIVAVYIKWVMTFWTDRTWWTFKMIFVRLPKSAKKNIWRWKKGCIALNALLWVLKIFRPAYTFRTKVNDKYEYLGLRQSK